MSIETVTIANVPGYDAAFDLYRAEILRTGGDDGGLLASTSHGDFLSRHIAAVAAHRHLKREWPANLARLVPTLGLADLWRIADGPPLSLDDIVPDASAAGPAPAGMDDISFMEMVADWYRLRKGRELAFDFIAPERLALYRELARRYAAGTWPEASVQSFVAAITRMFTAYADGLPSRNFSIDLATGAVASEPR